MHLLSGSWLASLALGVTVAWAGEYTVIDLGTLPGYTHSKAAAVNSLGQVVGHVTDDLTFGPDRAFFWDGAMIDVGTIEGTDSRAGDINDAGQVIGFSSTSDVFNSPQHAFVWQDGVMTDLGTLGGNESWAFGISPAGTISGASRLSGTDSYHACVWQDETLLDLGTLGGCCSYGLDTNDAGLVVGWASVTDFLSHAAYWQDGVLNDLGLMGEARAVNNAGRMVGHAYVGGGSEYHAVFWDEGTLTDLGTLPGGTNSRADDINEMGDIVGESWSSDQYPGQPHATLWSEGAVVDLNDVIPPGSGWELELATGINDLGQIVGYGTVSGTGYTRAFLLMPIADDCPGDANGDGTVDPLDSGFVLARFGCPVGGGDPNCDLADQNGDGAVDPLDVGFVLARFGPCDG